jgi:hypothetical protein
VVRDSLNWERCEVGIEIPVGWSGFLGIAGWMWRDGAIEEDMSGSLVLPSVGLTMCSCFVCTVGTGVPDNSALMVFCF